MRSHNAQPLNNQQQSASASATLIAETHWEAKWLTSEGPFDPAYERTTAALRRWVDGMEQAILARAARPAASR